MTIRRTVLNLEQLGARVLPSATAAVVTSHPTAAAAPAVQTTASTMSGSGRFTLKTASVTGAKTYTFQGSANLGKSGFFAISGSITTVGNRSGQATGRIVISDPRGALTLALTGPTQSANSGLPTSLTYRVVSGTGFFARYSGTGTYRVSAALFPGYNDRGNFTVTSTLPVVSVPTTPPPVRTTTGPAWQGQGRYTIATNRTTSVQTYALEGSANFGSSGFFGISGSIATVGNKSGQSHGRITLRDRRGTLTLSLTGPTQTARSGLPGKFTYKVVSGTGFFAHYAGTGTFQLAAVNWPGWSDKGHFDAALKPVK